MEHRGLDYQDYLIMKTSNEYEDIINLPHHVSTKYPQMDLKKRAAQFAPFAALVGYDDLIEKSSREHEQLMADIDSGIGDGIDDYYEYYK